MALALCTGCSSSTVHTDKKEVLNMDRYGIEIVLKDDCKKEDKTVKDILKQLDGVKKNQPYLLPSTKKNRHLQGCSGFSRS